MHMGHGSVEVQFTFRFSLSHLKEFILHFCNAIVSWKIGRDWIEMDMSVKYDRRADLC
jgi:hypothetical protein